MRFFVAYVDPTTLRGRQVQIDTDTECSALEAARMAGLTCSDDTEFAVCNFRVDATHRMSEGERLDVLTAILIDPKQARMLRAQNAQQNKTRRNVARHGGKHQLVR